MLVTFLSTTGGAALVDAGVDVGGVGLDTTAFGGVGDLADAPWLVPWLPPPVAGSCCGTVGAGMLTALSATWTCTPDASLVPEFLLLDLVAELLHAATSVTRKK